MLVSEAQKILQEFLGSDDRHEDCLTFNQMQGAIVATQSCPEYVSGVDIGFLALTPEDEKGLEAWFADGQLSQAWVVLWNHIDESLVDEKYSLLHEFPQQKDGIKPSDALAEWCQGYLEGSMLTEVAWQEAHNFVVAEGLPATVESHNMTLDMINALADWGTALAESEDPQSLVDNYSLILKAVDEGIPGIYKMALILEDYQLNAELPHDPIVRAGPKIGRNDPCPCGSGKKYKRCCL